MVLISILLLGIIASINSCQHEFVPTNATVSYGVMASVTK